MIATGRIDMVVTAEHYIYVMELKLSNNGGLSAAEAQIKANQYAEPFKADKKRQVIALAVELDEQGKGLVDWKKVEGYKGKIIEDILCQNILRHQQDYDRNSR